MIAAIPQAGVIRTMLRPLTRAAAPPPIAPARSRQAAVAWVASCHNVVRGLGGDVRAVEGYRTPFACAIPCDIAPSSTPNALPSPILRRLSRTSHSRAAPCSAWFRGAPAGRHGARGARQAPRASMAVGGGVRPGGRSEKGRLDFLYV